MTEDFRGPRASRFDWDHILDRHSDEGLIAHQSGVKTIFAGLAEAEIKARVKAAWKKRSRIKSQRSHLGVERIYYRGADAKSGEIIRFWYNVKTKTVTTAFPEGHRI